MTSPCEQVKVRCPECGHVFEGVAVGVRLLALAVMDFEAGFDDTREGGEILRHAIDFGVLDDAETARAYQWIRFAGDARSITIEPKDGDR